MVKVSKVFVALLVCFIIKKCHVESASASSGSSGDQPTQCGSGFVQCTIDDGEIGCVELCSNSTSRCKSLDVDNRLFCRFINDCSPLDTLVVEATGTSLLGTCNFLSGGGSCRIACFGSCGEIDAGCGSGLAVPTCTGCTTCAPVCMQNS